MFFEQGGPGRSTVHPGCSHWLNPDFYGSARESAAFFSGCCFRPFPVKQVPQIIPVNHRFIAADLIPKLLIFLFQFVGVQLSTDRLKKGTLLLGGLLIAGGAAAGTISYISHRKQRKLDEQFGVALQNYLDAARAGSLTLDKLNALIDAIDAIEKASPDKALNLNISASQFSELIHCIFDFTLRTAEANNFDPKAINHPHYFKKKTAEGLKYYLNMQKQIFEQAA